MFDNAGQQVSPRNYQLTSRRTSFRSSLNGTSLPDEYLEALEQKRRQLDESIHKYVASKEREYKTYEKSLKAQHASTSQSLDGRLQSNQPLTGHETRTRTEYHPQKALKSARRRASSESSAAASLVDFHESAQTLNNQEVSAEMTFAEGEAAIIDGDATPIEDRAAITRLTNRRASIERDKDFSGLFTPVFLTAIDDKPSRMSPDKSSVVTADKSEDKGDFSNQESANPATSHPDSSSEQLVEGIPRVKESARNKRPSQLQLTSRTSSSGSSADGRLASALKSPTQNNAKPNRKRVSLAVGDSIVAPTDSIPPSQSISNHAPSHSRVRVLSSERIVSSHPSPLSQTTVHSPSPTIAQIDSIASSMPLLSKNPKSNSVLTDPFTDVSKQPSPTGVTNTPATAPIDPDGDFFDLEVDEDGGLFDPTQKNHDTVDIDDLELKRELSPDTIVGGRADNDSPEDSRPRSYEAGRSKDAEYNPVADFMTESDGTADPPVITAASDNVQVQTRQISAIASQQPKSPGFRRPSVQADPIFAGSVADYATAESRAVEEDVYGSRYTGAGSKTSSFRGGSVGESFMERNASELMRLRLSGTPTTSRHAGELRS